MKLFNQAAKYVSSALLVVGASAHAALPVGAEAAITQYGVDVVAAIGFLILAGISIFSVRKLGSKMGWL